MIRNRLPLLINARTNLYKRQILIYIHPFVSDFLTWIRDKKATIEEAMGKANEISPEELAEMDEDEREELQDAKDVFQQELDLLETCRILGDGYLISFRNALLDVDIPTVRVGDQIIMNHRPLPGSNAG